MDYSNPWDLSEADYRAKYGWLLDKYEASSKRELRKIFSRTGRSTGAKELYIPLSGGNLYREPSPDYDIQVRDPFTRFV